MTEEGLATVLGALRSSFPWCDLRLMRGPYYMATCSLHLVRPRPFGALPLDERLRRELHRSAPWADLDELFEDHRVSEEVLRSLPPMPRDNTDDFPTLEFQVSRRPGRDPRHVRDPFLWRRTEFGIDPTRGWEAIDAGRAARRAGAFYVLNRDYFRAFFAPRLAADDERQRAFDAWMDKHALDRAPRPSRD